METTIPKADKKVSQFIYGNECTLPLSSVKIGELFFDDYEDKIGVYEKTENGSKLIKVVNNYGELYLVENINIEPRTTNYIILNP